MVAEQVRRKPGRPRENPIPPKRNISDAERERRREHARMLNATGKAHQGAPRKFTNVQVIGALFDARGLVTKAAEILKCHETVVYDYINTYPDIAEARKYAEERLLDHAESKLYEHIERGTPWAIVMFLKTRGKHRGYVERTEVAGVGNQPITVNIDRAPRRIEVEAHGKLVSNTQDTSSDQ